MSKIINTRIGLKYDLYSNWEVVEQTFIPLRGEVIFYEFPANTGAHITEPAILFKVGDGTHTLYQLPWGQAIAADVYAWAKKASLLGGTFNDQTGEWNFETQDPVYINTRNELMAYVGEQNAGLIKVKMDLVSRDNFESIYGRPFNPGQQSDVEKLGKYQISVSTREKVIGEDPQTHEPIYGPDYQPSGDPVDLAVTVKKLRFAEDGYAASYVIEQGGVQMGDTINIPKDYLVKSAELKTVTEENVPYQGAHVGDKYIDFVVNTKDNDILYWNSTDIANWNAGHSQNPATWAEGDPVPALPTNITYDFVNDENSWNAAYNRQDSGLKAYYEKNPTEDRWNETENRAANFNDKVYQAYYSQDGTTWVNVEEWQAYWQSELVQKVTNRTDSSKVYYTNMFYSFDQGAVYEVFNEESMTTSAGYMKFESYTFPDCVPSYKAINPVVLPWLVLSMPAGAGIVKCTSDQENEYYPWGDSLRKFPSGYGIAGSNDFGTDTFTVGTATVENRETNEHIYLPVQDLVDIYTGDEEYIHVDSQTKEISAITASLQDAQLETCTFDSYSAETGGTQYSHDGTVSIISKDTEDHITTVKVINNPGYPEWVGGIYTVHTDSYEQGVRYQLYQGNVALPVWVEITSDTPSTTDGLATVLDVKAYVDSQVGGSSANVVAGDGINITDAASTKIVSVNLDETTQTPGLSQNSGLAVGPDGLRINDEIVWEFHCGSSTENI